MSEGLAREGTCDKWGLGMVLDGMLERDIWACVHEAMRQHDCACLGQLRKQDDDYKWIARHEQAWRQHRCEALPLVVRVHAPHPVPVRRYPLHAPSCTGDHPLLHAGLDLLIDMLVLHAPSRVTPALAICLRILEFSHNHHS